MKPGTKVLVTFEGVIIDSIPDEGTVRVSVKDEKKHSFWAVVSIESIKEIENEKTATLGGDDCYSGRVPANPARIIVTLPYGEHKFIAYDSSKS